LSERVRLARERKLKEDLRANEFLERRKEEQKKLPDPKPFHHRHGLREYENVHKRYMLVSLFVIF